METGAIQSEKEARSAALSGQGDEIPMKYFFWRKMEEDFDFDCFH